MKIKFKGKFEETAKRHQDENGIIDLLDMARKEDFLKIFLNLNPGPGENMIKFVREKRAVAREQTEQTEKIQQTEQTGQTQQRII